MVPVPSLAEQWADGLPPPAPKRLHICCCRTSRLALVSFCLHPGPCPMHARRPPTYLPVLLRLLLLPVLPLLPLLPLRHVLRLLLHCHAHERILLHLGRLLARRLCGSLTLGHGRGGGGRQGRWGWRWGWRLLNGWWRSCGRSKATAAACWRWRRRWRRRSSCPRRAVVLEHRGHLLRRFSARTLGHHLQLVLRQWPPRRGKVWVHDGRRPLSSGRPPPAGSGPRGSGAVQPLQAAAAGNTDSGCLLGPPLECRCQEALISERTLGSSLGRA